MRKYSKLILLSIFVISFCFLFFAAKSDSQTTDEGIHLVAGYTYLTKGDFRLDPEHPPLIKELSAVPLLFSNTHTDFDGLWQKAGNFYYDSWQEARALGEQFLYGWGNSAQETLLLGRLVIILLTLVLGYFAYFWAKKLYGEKAGIFAAFLVLFFPNILAHGHLINTDLGVTLFAFISFYFWGEYLKKPNWFNFIFTGLFTGLMLASKYTGAIFLVAMVVLGLIRIYQERKLWIKIIGGFIGSLGISFLVVWATYGFKILVPPTLLNGSFTSELARWSGSHNSLPSILNPIYDTLRPILLPSFYYKGLIMVGRHAVGGHGSFLLGMHSNTGWWYYFPIAILTKTPIPIFIFLTLAIYYFKKIKHSEIFNEYILLVAPIVYLVVSMSSKADLGIRHVLPIFPFLFVFMSKSINLIDFKKISVKNVLFGLLIVWYFLSACLTFPNYMAYFNEFVGGPKNGHKILSDSNLDWGQDLGRISDYIQKNNIHPDYIVYPWDGDPSLNYYGLNYPVLQPDDHTAKGTVIIAATYYETEAYSWLHQYSFTEISPSVFLVEMK